MGSNEQRERPACAVGGSQQPALSLSKGLRYFQKVRIALILLANKSAYSIWQGS
jgi:hypothetical protein